MERFKEIFRLKEMLEAEKIPFIFRDIHDGHQILYPDFTYHNGYICSVVEHGFNYGHEHDLLEISGLLTREEESIDSVVGYLSAEEVFNRIKKHWLELSKFINEGDLS